MFPTVTTEAEVTEKHIAIVERFCFRLEILISASQFLGPVTEPHEFCRALRDLLCADLEYPWPSQTLKADASQIMAQAKSLADMLSAQSMPPPATPELLVRAKAELDATKEKIAALEAAQGDPNNQLHQVAAFSLPDLRLQLDREEKWVSDIQKQLEAQAK